MVTNLVLTGMYQNGRTKFPRWKMAGFMVTFASQLSLYNIVMFRYCPTISMFSDYFEE